ncbi:hypothetical protein ACLK2E_02635 [Escherichia coli]
MVTATVLAIFFVPVFSWWFAAALGRMRILSTAIRLSIINLLLSGPHLRPFSCSTLKRTDCYCLIYKLTYNINDESRCLFSPIFYSFPVSPNSDLNH